jgi:glycosyltransferase involved in cell wall biosynthesis
MISVVKARKKIEYLIEGGDLNSSLRLISNYVDRLITEPVCSGEGYGSIDLDRLCAKIGEINLNKLLLNNGEIRYQSSLENEKIVYVVSKLQRSGGHSRLVQDFIKLQPRKQHVILSTEIAGASDVKYFKEIFRNFSNVEFIQSPKGALNEKLTWLQKKLLYLQPALVYLLNHHQDSVAVAALTPKLCAKGIFCHHGDHHLSLGVYLDHFDHIDFHPMGYHYCRNELGLNNLYVPLTFEDKSCSIKRDFCVNKKVFLTATAAGFNKVEIPYFESYFEVIANVLENTDVSHLHIGKLTPWGLRKIRKELGRRGVDKERFIYIEWTPSVWQLLQQYKVDIYIASFPHGAGLTLIEAMGAGVPVIMHEHINSRVLSSLELAYPESFRWRESKDLIEYLKNITHVSILAERELARKWYEKNHRSEILESYLNNPGEFKIEVPPLSKDFGPKRDEWAAWVDEQFSVSKLIYRWMYRLAKAIKRHLY